MTSNPAGVRGIGRATMPPPEGADIIDLTVARLKGKTLAVHSPLDFAKAVEEIRRR
jgi:hypothetical protein